MHSVVLSTAYFPPVSYFALILNSGKVYIETEENYSKQTYRNRCVILGANGPLNLTVPVEHTQPKIVVKDLAISYHSNWQLNHKRAIESAYRNSPFYEYYIDDFMSFFNEKTHNLLELNNQILNTCLELIGYKETIEFTTDFVENAEHDFRNTLSPKKPIPDIYLPEYHQVFITKFGFIPNLSILDLIFNAGPETKDILLNSYKKEMDR